jgi:hypothetical protein
MAAKGWTVRYQRFILCAVTSKYFLQIAAQSDRPTTLEDFTLKLEREVIGG